MKTPPDIDLDQLQSDLEATYGLQTHAMMFLPRGECSWSYRLEADGAPYFLKLFRGSPLPEWAARLTHRLHTMGPIEQVSYPLAACSGKLVNHLAGFDAAVFPFIEGLSLREVPPESRQEILYRLGQLLAQIHTCHSLDAECERVEQFEPWSLDKYRQVVKAAASSLLPGTAGQAQAMLRPVEGRLERLLEDLMNFQQRARQKVMRRCICHGDPTPGNILVTPDGLPHLIDWDDVILAPPERDLVFWEQDEMFFESQSVSPVLEGYRSIIRHCDLDADIVGFYHRQWTAGEIGEYGHRLLFENQDAQQNQSDLENLEEELKWLQE